MHLGSSPHNETGRNEPQMKEGKGEGGGRGWRKVTEDFICLFYSDNQLPIEIHYYVSAYNTLFIINITIN